jgi:hypothetical protein
MKRLRPSRSSPALIVSIIALVVALGGTAVAAATRISGYDLKPQTVDGWGWQAEAVHRWLAEAAHATAPIPSLATAAIASSWASGRPRRWPALGRWL